MRNKITLLSLCLMFIAFNGFAQKNKQPKSIISKDVVIKKYHNKEELSALKKGEILDLYTERVKALSNLIPYVAFATKPGVTMENLGIPLNSNNIKQLSEQQELTKEYIDETNVFYTDFLAYADTSKLIAAVLFYEEVMKLIHYYDEFN